MNHVFRQFSMGAVAIAIMQAASAQVSMTNIVPMQIAGQGTEIRVMFNGLPPQPQAYQLENPSRLILDFDKAQQGLKQSKISVATNEASSVDVTSDDQRSRFEPYRVCRRVNILRDYPDDKTKLYPRN